MLTIMAGEWGGRALKAPEKAELRPSSGRVKSSIFSILEAIQWKRAGAPDFSAWHCLDLFAGVGGLGLEILSRGAAHCVFVEKVRGHARFLEQNIAALQAGKRSTVLVEPAEALGWVSQGPFDLMLLDPPYALAGLPDLLLAVSPYLKPQGGILLFEHDPKLKFTPPPGCELHSERKLGPAGITVFLRN